MSFYTTDSSLKFIIGSLFLLIVILISGLFLLESAARYLSEETDREKFNNIYSSSEKNKKYLLIGTSHAKYDLDVFRNFDSTIDLTGAYTLPPVMYYKLKKAVELNKKIEVLYLEADYHLFYNGRIYTGKGNLIHRWAHFFEADAEKILGPAYAKPSATKSPATLISLQDNISPILLKRIFHKIYLSISELVHYKKSENNTPVFDICNNMIWSDIIGKFEKTYALNPGNSDEADEDKRLIYARNRLKGFGINVENKLDHTMVDYYDKTLLLAKENGLNIILIRFPLVDEYLAGIPNKIKNDVDKLLNDLSKKYELSILDYRYIFKGRKELFLNADHLNKMGDLELSNKFRNDICSF